jgi:hypothetical protein
VADVRPDYGDIFRIADVNGKVLIQSGANKSLPLKFPNAMTFQIRVGAKDTDLILLRIGCDPFPADDAG